MRYTNEELLDNLISKITIHINNFDREYLTSFFKFIEENTGWFFDKTTVTKSEPYNQAYYNTSYPYLFFSKKDNCCQHAGSTPSDRNRSYVMSTGFLVDLIIAFRLKDLGSVITLLQDFETPF